jgi:hypothetical protein
LFTHRRIHLQGVRAWVRSAAAVAVLSASRGPGVWRRAALVLVAIHVAHLAGTAIISFRWTCSSSFGDVGSLKRLKAGVTWVGLQPQELTPRTERNTRDPRA